MKARFEFDQKALEDMEVEITFKTSLRDWRKVVDALGPDGPWPVRMLGDGARQIVRAIDATTSVTYAALRPYGHKAEPETPPAATAAE